MVFYNGHCCGHCAGTVRALYGHCVLPAFSTCWEGRGSRAHEAGAPDGGQGRRRAISAAAQAPTGKQTSKRPGKRARGMALAPAVARAAAIQGKFLLWGPRANRDRRSARFRMQLPPISLCLSLTLSLSLSCATLAGGGKLVKTTYRRNCTVFPTIVFTNMVLA